MKKCFLFMLCSIWISLCSAFSEAPDLLSGVWEGTDRIIYIPKDTSQNISVILKTLYGWYYDRSAESDSIATDAKRTLNSVTKPVPEKLIGQYRALPIMSESVLQNKNSGVWEMTVHYGKNEDVSIPVAVINGSLYLDFAIRNVKEVQQVSKDTLEGFWERVSSASGITLSTPVLSENCLCYYVLPDTVYGVRYWKTDMEFDDSQVQFHDDGITLYLDKHLPSAQSLFTCVMGRRKIIRNADVKKLKAIPELYTVDDSGLIMGFGIPYLKKTTDMQNYQDVLALVETMNKRRKPDPDPLFPPSDVNWHYDTIYRLEAGNPWIAAVRQRQKEFAEKVQQQNR